MKSGWRNMPNKFTDSIEEAESGRSDTVPGAADVFGLGSLPERRSRQVVEREVVVYQPDPNSLVNQGDGTFKYKDYVLTKKGLLFEGTGNPDQWDELGHILFNLETSLQLWIGDWLVQAERTWGATYSKVAEVFEKDVDTLYNYHWVCSSVDFSLRGEKLNFSHYKAVASMPPQYQNYWLRLAESKEWSARALERNIHKIGKPARKKRQIGQDESTIAKSYTSYIETELPGLENAPAELRQNVAERAEWLSHRYALIAERARSK